MTFSFSNVWLEKHFSSTREEPLSGRILTNETLTRIMP